MKAVAFWLFLVSFTTLATAANREVTAAPNAADIAKASATARMDAHRLAEPELAKLRLMDSLTNLPLRFEANQGQTDARVKFLARGAGYTLFLTADEAVLVLRQSPDGREGPLQLTQHQARRTGLPEAQHTEKLDVVRMEFAGANASAEPEGLSELEGKSNYFIGNDPAKWRTDVPSYSEVVYHDLWPKVDLRFYSNGGDLETEYIVRPGGDLSRVRIAYRGIEDLRIAPDGSLRIQTVVGQLTERLPQIYQEVTGKRVSVPGHFKLLGNDSYTFEVDSRNSEYALVIDPILFYSSFLSASAGVTTSGINVDSQGNAYVTGGTMSVDFPITAGAFDTVYPPNKNCSGGFPCGSAFIAKFNSTGTGLVYSTYLGGNANDFGNALTLDAAGNAYVYGRTSSTNFPITSGAYTHICSQGYHVFVTKLNPAGSALIYSSVFGGCVTDFPANIALDSAGNSYLTGVAVSPDYPTTPGAFQTTCTSTGFFGECHTPFLSKLSADGSQLIYSTYLDGYLHGQNNGGTDQGNGVAVDAFGFAYVAGVTSASDFPTTPGAFQTTNKSSGYANLTSFVTKFNFDGSGLVYSTYLGGSNDDSINKIAVDSTGNAYVAGGSVSQDFPTTPGSYQTTHSAVGMDAFVTKLNTDGTGLVYSTLLGNDIQGGGTQTVISDIAVDALGDAYVFGTTQSNAFPTTPGALQSIYSGGGGDAFLTKFSPLGSTLVYSTYLGGSQYDNGQSIALDSAGNAYLTGSTQSPNFPVTQGAFQTRCGTDGNCNATIQATQSFVSQVAFGGLFSVSYITLPQGGNTGTVTIQIVGSGFQVGATAKLVCSGQADILPLTETMSVDLNMISAVFDLARKPLGNCSVVVTNPNGTTASLPNSFKIVLGTPPNIWAGLASRGRVRGDLPPELVPFIFGNSGNIDAPAPVFILSSDTPGVQFSFSSNGPFQNLPLHIFGVSNGVPGLLAPGITNVIPLYLKVPQLPGHTMFTIHIGAIPTIGQPFAWKQLAALGVPFDDPPGDWSTRVAVAQSRIGNLWDNVVAALLDLADQPVPQAQNLFKFDDVFGFLITDYGTQPQEFTKSSSTSSTSRARPSTASAAGSADCSDVQIRVVAAHVPPTHTYIFTHGFGGYTDPSTGAIRRPDIWDAAQAVHQQDPNATVLILDWSPGAHQFGPKGLPETWKACNNVPHAANCLVELLSENVPSGAIVPKEGGLSGIYMFGESYGNDVNFQIAQQFGPVGCIAAFDPNNEFTGCAPPHFSSASKSSVAFHTTSLFDSKRKSADCDVALETLPDWGEVDKHIGGFQFLQVRLQHNDTSWLDPCTKLLPPNGPSVCTKAPEPSSYCMDGTVYRNGTYDPTPACGAPDYRVETVILPASSSLNFQDVPFEIVFARDPNEKVGPQGGGMQHYISGATPFTYGIFFENQPTATAAARNVAITDHLNPAIFDLSTFSFGPIAFGTQLISVPSGLSDFSTTVDLRPTTNLLVAIGTHMNRINGSISWQFTSLDPLTFKPPSDPTLGFLPPDTNPPAGEGKVFFSITPRTPVSTGSQITNRATVVFDQNPPILTRIWSNTIDTIKPTSKVSPLPVAEQCPNFQVSWTGSDVGSGVQSFTIFVSDNSAAFAQWLTNSTATSGKFPGQLGHTYAFYSQATDFAGNVENSHTTADATTRVPQTVTGPCP